MIDDEIEINVSSDRSYEKLIVDIYYQGRFLALLSQDEGEDAVKIEFPDYQSDDEKAPVARKVPLKVFDSATFTSFTNSSA